MPIRPENKARYPKTWKAMVALAGQRSGGKCECDGKCGIAHEGGRCGAVNYEPHPVTGSKVVLTLAHEHGVALEETSVERMFHACQRCHNRYDMPMRRAGMMERAYRNQMVLFGGSEEDYAPVLRDIEEMRENCLARGRIAQTTRLNPTPAHLHLEEK